MKPPTEFKKGRVGFFFCLLSVLYSHCNWNRSIGLDTCETAETVLFRVTATTKTMTSTKSNENESIENIPTSL